MTASVAVSRMQNGVLNYHNAGKIQASSEPQDNAPAADAGHPPRSSPTRERRRHRLRRGRHRRRCVDRSGARDRDDRRNEPLVPRVVSTYFPSTTSNVVRNPKVHVQIDDGRHYVVTLKGKFDALTSDPLDPW